MAWIELHQSLPTHKKTVRLKNLLRIKIPQAVGHLCILWLWALDNAPDGDLSEFSAEEIAEFANWEPSTKGGRTATFLEALQSAGFVSSDMKIHDWNDYAGRLIEQREIQREQSRIRQQKRREKLKGSNGSVTRDTRVTQGEVTRSPYPTVPNPTVPNTFVVVDECAHEQSAVEGFLDERGQRLELYFGFSEEIQAKAEQISRRIYDHYSLKPPTKMDIANVFECTLVSVAPDDATDHDAWRIEFPKSKVDLLMYAFEAAAEAGSPGNWKYIRGVLGRLHDRGITTLEQAETFDLDRVERR